MAKPTSFKQIAVSLAFVASSVIAAPQLLLAQTVAQRRVREVRGMGSMIGIELDRPCGELVLQGLNAGLVFNVTADNVIRLLPPLVMNEAEAREVVSRLLPVMKAFLEKRDPEWKGR